MIHELLRLERTLILLDTETTGTDTSKDRIIQLGVQAWGPGGKLAERETLINPEIPIPARVTKIHGISDEMMTRCARCKYEPDRCTCEAGFKKVPTFKDIAEPFAHTLSGCDFGGKNVRFDLRILQAEMDRAGVRWSYAKAYIIDAERIEQLAVPRTLSDLYKKYTGETLQNAHGALTDVEASCAVLIGQLETHPNLPRDVEKLHNLQWPGQLDVEGKFRMIDGVPVCQFGKWRGYAMWDIEKSYWDWILKSNFPADVLALATDAKLGKFPGR